MNTLKVFVGNNTQNLFIQSLKMVEPFLHDIKQHNIIIVPDKLSLICEQSIFEVLNIDAYFNLEVMGIGKFVQKILASCQLDTLSYNTIECKFLTHIAIKNVCKDFKCFSKNFTLGFVDEIYAKIEQLKSSKVDICDLYDPNASEGTKLKYNDLKLIYNEYQKIKIKPDANEILEMFNETTINSEYLKNCNVFFIGFDALTKQGLQILKNVVLGSKYCQISITAPKDQANYRIYDKVFLDSVINLCKQNNFECQTKWVDCEFENQDKNLILNNLFSRKQKFNVQNQYFSITKANTPSDEIDICCKSINYILKNNDIKFNQIAICADPSYHQILKTNLTKLGIDVHLDQSMSLVNLEPVKFLINYLKYINTKKTKYLKFLITNDFCSLKISDKCDLINLLDKYSSLKNIQKFESLQNTDLIDFLKKFDVTEITNVSKNDFLAIVQFFLINFEVRQKIENKILEFENRQEVYLQKTYMQILDKLESIFEMFKNLLNDEIYPLNNLIELFEKTLQDTQILAVPSGTNQIFIGDSKCFYMAPKYLYVLGLNQSTLPRFIGDLGLISDKEIMSETLLAKIEPTTTLVNKRSKFKLFEILLSATKKVFLSYHIFSKGSKGAQPNDFVLELEYLFKNNTINASSLKFLDGSSDINKICFNTQNVYNANILVNENIDKKCQAIILKALYQNNYLALKPVKNNVQIELAKLFFKQNKPSISIIENYCACPKLAFLSRGLKLKPKQKDSVEANVLGTFIHEVAEKFTSANLKKLGSLSQEGCELSVKQIIQKIQEDKKYYMFKLPENLYLLNMLSQECQRFCKFINDQQAQSNFKIISQEQTFGGYGNLKPIQIEVQGQKYFISGIVDRIDECDDRFLIVDYKTGNTTNASGMQHLFYGTKIQLFVYAKAIGQNINKKFFGAFYLPIKNSFKKQGAQDYSFSGFYENNTFYALNLDKNLSPDMPKSKIFGAKLNKKANKDGELVLFNGNNVLTEQQLKSYCDYAIEMVKSAIKDINLGYICPSPIKNKCSICEFKNICKYYNDEKVIRQENYDINKDTFMEILN